ncbi:MAG TPA: malto-oligosyltrehalose synthase [Rubrobacteraceae bacterium]|nr:malto-oligosyltrehalose synthase [Rubrobacteraceae bacterium]
MRVPRATYRLQFNKDFTFKDAAGLVPYLADLGVSDLYASPYMKARPGSTHGYDIIDHNALNPEIGTPEDYERLVETLHEHGMGQLLDWVPNHMGVGSDNEWWLDVLENGPASPYARFFDIDWYPTNRGELRGKVLLPVLGDHYRVVLESGDLKLDFDAEAGAFSINYYEHRCPLDPRTYPVVLEHLSDLPEDELALELGSLITAFGNLPDQETTDEERLAERVRDAAVHKSRLARLCEESPEIARAVEECVRRVSGEAGNPESFETLHRVLEEQAYRLVYWRVASDEINYRRFFSVNDLAGIRVEDEQVFEETHRYVLDLVRQGKVDGLRLDHPDGLYDPAGYFRRLQERAGEALESSGAEPLYVLVEKILAAHEGLPEDWTVAGTTGYEFANLVNGLFVDLASEADMERVYRSFLDRPVDLDELLYGCKKAVMRGELASELNVLSRRLLRLSEYGRRTFDFTINVLRDALTEIVAAFPVYRTYITREGLSEQDRRYVDWAVTQAKKRSTAADTSAYDFVHEVLLLNVEGPEEYEALAVAFVMKFQQYTGPVMAKGMEDTALYIYNRLVSLNEVGGEPERFGVSVAAFHHLTAERAKRWPHAMLSTSTHDTKRSEDVRARINILSKIPDEWRERLDRWSLLNRSRRREVDGRRAPSPNDEYLLYQSLVGAWPLEELDENGLADFRARIEAYMEKALREAQVHTSWVNVNEEYEAAVSDFIEALLTPSETNLFLDEFVPFAREVAWFGALNSLSQTLIKLTSPGVPDIYQGNELWDFSLVDPDNRRPVDYGRRRELLTKLEGIGTDDVRSLLESWQDGRPKLHLTRQALTLRRQWPELFETGEYVPLEVHGARADHHVAFARRRGEELAITAAPRLYTGLGAVSGALLPDPDAWSETWIDVSDLPSTTYRNVLTGETVGPEEQDGKAMLPAKSLLGSFPVALLKDETR